MKILSFIQESIVAARYSEQYNNCLVRLLGEYTVSNSVQDVMIS
jgi:hypothetical protein